MSPSNSVTSHETSNSLKIISFGYETKSDRQLLKKFVNFHWKHYENDPHYIPLLDYEYLGFKLIGMTGFFEPRNLFFKHGEMRFFLILKNNEVVGRCNAFINHNHNKHWNDKVGFWGQFEVVNDQAIANTLLNAAEEWLRSKGMDTIRGPQNLPINEATPGIMTDGFDTRPVIYYHYNKPYYATIINNAGYELIKRVLSWEIDMSAPTVKIFDKNANEIIERFKIKMETWDERPLKVRRQEMLDVYNDAWSDNFGFVPFTQEEFYKIVDDMQLVMDKSLFVFGYIDNKLAAFFGGVPNVAEQMHPVLGFCRSPLLRAVKMILNKGKTKGFRLGYLGVKKEYRRMGLAGVMLWKQKEYAIKKGYQYCDMGWVLEDNYLITRMIDELKCPRAKTYSIFQKSLK
jgi:hypothetical protein